ncbi:hypothetical protein BKA66DRAFT_250111 [Pyrenochaeta sp. MPI-SDFR-AT-0127]|nr:hypothetical protein BKA66DRAFT_250111 [Pyrenochaeta sp. MPI-SDFR-AT-0127]
MLQQCIPWFGGFVDLLLSCINKFSPSKLGTEEPTTVEPALQTFLYPPASLLGLPTELRLQIYTHLARSLHLHIDYPSTWRQAWNRGTQSGERLRLCYTPDSTFCQLCAKPPFSGLHSPATLCHETRKSLNNAFALRACCRTIYEETRGILEKRKLGISMYADTADTTLRLLKPDARMHLTRVTIVDATFGKYAYSSGLHPTVSFFQHNARSFSSLQTLAIQTTQPRYKFCVKRHRRAPLFDPKNTWHKLWFVKVLQEAFEARVTIVLEAWVVVRSGYEKYTSLVDEIVIIRGTVWGFTERGRKGDLGFQMVRKPIVAVEEAAEWKKWWKLNNMGYGRRPS